MGNKHMPMGDKHMPVGDKHMPVGDRLVGVLAFLWNKMEEEDKAGPLRGGTSTCGSHLHIY